MRVTVLFIALVLAAAFAEAKTPVEVYVLPLSEEETSCELRPSKLHEIVANHDRSRMKSEEGCVLFLRQRTFEYLETEWRLDDYRYLDTEHRRTPNSNYNFTGRHLVVRSGSEVRFCPLPSGSPAETYYIDPKTCQSTPPTPEDFNRWRTEALPPWEREAFEAARASHRSPYRRPVKLGGWYN